MMLKLAQIGLVLARISVSCVLCFSGLLHWNNPYAFLVSVLDYRVLPFGVMSVTVAVLLPLLQLVVGVAIAIEPRSVAPMLMATGLFAALFFLQLSAWLRELQIDCGCFGALSHPVGIGTLTLVAILAAVSFISAGLQWDVVHTQR